MWSGTRAAFMYPSTDFEVPQSHLSCHTRVFNDLARHFGTVDLTNYIIPQT